MSLVATRGRRLGTEWPMRISFGRLGGQPELARRHHIEPRATTSMKWLCITALVRFDHFDACPVTGRLCERRIACDDRGLRRSARATYTASYAVMFPRSVHARVRRSTTSPVPCESTEALRHFNVCQVRSMEVVLVLKRCASTVVPSGVCSRNSRRAEASTTIARTRALADDHCGGVSNVIRFRP